MSSAGGVFTLSEEGRGGDVERAFWLIWSRIPGIGAVLLGRLQQQFGNLETAWTASPQALAEVDGIGEQVLDKILQIRSQLCPEQFLQHHQQQNPHFWTLIDAEYPRLLREISSPPAVLYYRGSLNLKENQGIKPMVAIVGTRDPSDYGRRWAARLTKALVHHGFTIVSGLADGIDAEAHRACLEAGGRTIAVVGTGVDLVYPARNRALYQQILQGGLILSEYVAGTTAERVHFPQRNRIVAGLCRAVLVIEAPEKSGALITAYLANEYGRDVYVLPGSLDNHRAIGCLGLVSRGAQLILSESHLLEVLGEMPQLDGLQPSLWSQVEEVELTTEQQQLLQILVGEPILLDSLVAQTGLPISTVSSALLHLELLGQVVQLPGMRYQRR